MARLSFNNIIRKFKINKNNYHFIYCRHYFTLRKVQKVLGFKLKSWQIMYIYGNSQQVVNGRGSGKTLAHQLKILLNYKEQPINLKQMRREDLILFSDYALNGFDRNIKMRQYSRWYINDLHDLYYKLSNCNIKLREIIF